MRERNQMQGGQEVKKKEGMLECVSVGVKVSVCGAR